MKKNDTLKIYTGYYLRYLIETDGITANYVAEALDINKGYFSAMLNGKANLSDETILAAFAFLQEKFSYSSTHLEEVKDYLSKILDSYLTIDYDNIEKILQTVLSKKDTYLHSPAFFHMQLILFIQKVIERDSIDEIRPILQIIHDYLRVFSEDEIFLFYLFKAEYYFDSYQYEEALQALSFAKQLALKLKNTIYLAVVLQTTSRITLYQGKATLTLANINKALNLFFDSTYFQRIQHLHISLADAYSLAGMYEDAISKCNDLLQHLDSKNVFFKVRIENALCLTYLRKKDYKHSLYYAREILKLDPTYENAILSIIVCLLNTNKKDCLQYIEDHKHEIHTDYVMHFIGLLEFYLKDDMDQFLKEAIGFIEYCPSYEYNEYIIDILIKYYSKKRQLRKVNELQKLLIKYLKEKQI